LKQRLKEWIFRRLGKDPEGVVVTFCTGPEDLCRRMADEVRSLIPDRRHFVATPDNWAELRGELKRYRIGLAPVMLGQDHAELRRAAYRLAPGKILAYNTRLERHHLKPDISSFLFWRGIPLDRIRLRPSWWLSSAAEQTIRPDSYCRFEGRPRSLERPAVAVLAPYLPYPLSHGGAVRMFHLLREIAREFDVELFAFAAGADLPPLSPLLEHCSRIVVVRQPRYREPRWSTLLPPEVIEFRSPGMRRALDEEKLAFGYKLLQVEYTQLAEYGGDVLVEHDVTFDLAQQRYQKDRRLNAWWELTRWRSFEMSAARRYRAVAVMSQKDAEMLGPAVRTRVIGNGVDLGRFRPEPEEPGESLLFIGSFRHYPNVQAYRFFVERVWPQLSGRFPNMTVTVVCGPDHLTYWRLFADSPEPSPAPRVRLLGFVEDVRPLYVESNLVIVPTTVSAGTNVKALEAMAMQRAIVSTTTGCAGLDLDHGRSVWIADTSKDFADGIAALIADPDWRTRMAHTAYWHAVRNFDWKIIGEQQRDLLRGLLNE
jgi:glycosyltransferase involved in cell wall biosynthesis